MIHALHLYGQPTESTPVYAQDLTYVAENWRRSVHYLHGYNVGSFTITERSMTREEIIELFHRIIGCHIVERSYGLTSWEGRVQEAHLFLDGVEFVSTLAPEFWHNRVQVRYTSSLGYYGVTDWAENTDASAIYGEMQAIVELPGATGDSADAMRDRELTQYAWPRTRMVGIANAADGTSLTCTVAGYWSTLNYRYREDNETANADALITTLVGESEFVTAGRIETNTLSVYVDTLSTPQRLGDLIESIMQQGDASGNLWVGGVYNDRKLRYEQAPDSADYVWRGGLRDKTDALVIPTLASAGIFVRNSYAPIGWPATGDSSLWDDRRIAFVEEVEFVAPEGLEVRFAGHELALGLLEAQLQAGSVPGSTDTGRRKGNA